jgi:hypothetical protein
MAKQPRIESYVAHKSIKATASAKAIQSAYKIEVRFLGGLTTKQKNAFKKAADRWSRVIVGDLPSVLVGGEVIDDLLIEAQGVAIDGVGRILGQAGPTNLRPATAGASALLPAKGIMSFDTADLASMESDGTLVDVITHEMGHVIGIGTIWEDKGLLAGAGTNNPRFTGKNAKRAYGKLRGSGPTAVPVENTGGAGTRDGHWRESVFKNELMSGFISESGNPLSRVTVASLKDLGYRVKLSAAEPYSLPDLQIIAERGLMLTAAPHAHALPILAPKVLPPDSLNV